MKRFRNVKKGFAAFMVVAMALTSTAYASWPEFQGNPNNTGAANTGVIGEQSDIKSTPLDLPNTGAWTGVDSQPVTYGDRAYALYNGGTEGAKLAAVDVSGETPSRVWDIVLSDKANNVSQLATPVITDNGDRMFAAVTYAQNVLTGTGGEHVIPSGQSVTATYTNVNLNGSFSNLQLTTDIQGTGKESAVVTMTNTRSGKAYTFTGASYSGSAFNVYYTDGQFIPEGTYTVAITVTNTGTADVKWTTSQLMANQWELLAVTGLTGQTPTVTRTGCSGAGQAATPLKLYRDKIYFGIYDGDCAYYQFDISNRNAVSFTPGGNNSFYWAGAAFLGDYVYFGSEYGIVYARNVNTFADSENSTTGSSIALKPLDQSELGDKDAADTHIRSSLTLDAAGSRNYLYFTTRNGILWRVQADGPNMVKTDYANLGKEAQNLHSTSTPAIVGNYVYVSTYGGYDPATFSSYGAVKRFNKETLADDLDIYGGDGKGASVQCSPVVYENGDDVYVYFTTNVSAGAGYCYSIDSLEEVAPVWTVPGTVTAGNGNYAIQGFAAGGGTTPFMVFGTDGLQLVVVK